MNMFISPFSNPYPSPFPGNFKVHTPQPIQPIPEGKRYLNFMAGSDGCAAYRRGFVSTHIQFSNLGDVSNLSKMIRDKEWYRGLTSISLQRQASSEQKEFMQFLKSIQPEMGFKMIYEVDDVVFKEEIPNYNASKFAFDTEEIRQNCIDMINIVDEVTVTCKFMRDLYIDKTGKKEITVIPNFMPYWWIGHQYDYKNIIANFDKHKQKPRILYTGSGAHFDLAQQNGNIDDFTHVLKFIIDNRHKYQFVFYGGVPTGLHPYVSSGEIEFHPWTTLMNYPSDIAKLQPQLTIAPLEDNNFNKSKSDIKFIEAAQLGIPCLCQDLVTYSSAPEHLRFTDADDLAEKVDRILNWKNKANYYRMIPELRQKGAERFLELPHNVGCFLEAIDTPWKSLDRKYLPKWN